ncbi:prepilin-type N-terminal cleavage/methylation domain-containing protein [Sedimentisphaera salicampi]|uniref:Type II secretion system protein G n=1 Tax=Sedimentisphaera salicampi TaxID=1941349 RepID=A0A1W6LJD9_9BACT|nr:prepilin-type N-terminal cleavage/methylation domain-containing protein [Sedimentisphaera salicampi]ARN55866.1 type II secretion system protein G [Sedimentisphaera salicampi]
MARTEKHKSGFTLIELLIVIAVTAMLISVLLPALASARQEAKSAVCKSRLRQMSLAANSYNNTYDGYFPLAYDFKKTDSGFLHINWDFIIKNSTTTKPGLLWMGESEPEIQQCPAFRGNSNTPSDSYTGYNYNTSYIGRGANETVSRPAKIEEISRPYRCAVFGDGEFSGGANKFMRSPEPSRFDKSFSGRNAGTQGYRHNGKTNIAWADGHVNSQKKCFAENSNATRSDIENLAEGTGFLSSDNSAYSLKP